MATKHSLELEEHPNKRTRLELEDREATQADRERAAGITSFVSPDVPGFSCIFKQRYTDFLVNEILPDGHVLHLEDDGKKKPRKNVGTPAEFSTAKPAEAAQAVDPEAQPQPQPNGESTSVQNGEVPSKQNGESKLKENGQERSEQSGKAPAESEGDSQITIPDLSAESKTSLEGIFGEATAGAIINLHAAVLKYPHRKPRDHPTVYSGVLAEKSKRTEAHAVVRNIFNSKLETTTLQDQPGVISVKAAPTRVPTNTRSQMNHEGANGSLPKGKVGWEELGGEYLHFTLYKENKDTMEVLFFIASQLKVPVKNFQFAGTKDRRGVTVQKVAIFRMHANRLAGLNRMAKGWIVGGFEHKKHGLDLGELTGNEFVITLRDCHVNGEDTTDSTLRLGHVKQVVSRAADSFRTRGFLNYYGLQRFGTFRTGTDVVGMKMLKGDLEGAIDSILTYSDDMLPENQSSDSASKNPQDDINRADAIRNWRTTGSINDGMGRMPRRFQAENAIMQYLGKTDRRTGKPSQAKDWQGALMQIQRNLRLMYVHAYQSRVWNTMASKRWTEFGSKVVEGDLVIIGEKGGDDTEVKDEVDQDGEEIVRPAADDSAPSAEDAFTRARQLTKEEADSGTYDIFDIVLPLPGFDVLYPANKIGKFYEEFMASEEGGELDPHNMRRAWKDVSLSGGYRKMMSRPGKGFEVDVREYEHDDEQLVETDRERLGKQEAKTDAGSVVENGDGAKAETTSDQPSQKKIAVVLRFQLGSSQYATMALTELTKGGAVPYKPDFSSR